MTSVSFILQRHSVMQPTTDQASVFVQLGQDAAYMTKSRQTETDQLDVFNAALDKAE